ncbi:hypothetical protein HN51_028919 [Arachis hypogaea]
MNAGMWLSKQRPKGLFDFVDHSNLGNYTSPRVVSGENSSCRSSCGSGAFGTVADSATAASFQVHNNPRGTIHKAVYASTQPHSRTMTFATVWVAIDVEAAFDLR